MTQLETNLELQNEAEQIAFRENMDALLNIATAAEIAMLQNYNAFLASLGVNITGAPTHDAGGYFMPGMARNASGQAEWVLNPATTRYAENIVGGRLTQQNLIASMVSGRSGGYNGGSSYRAGDTYNMSGLTAQDRLLVRGMLSQALQEFKQRELS